MTNLPDQPNSTDEVVAVISSAIAVFADLERDRLAVQREQQAVALRTWEVIDSSDRRQNETAIKGIEADTEKDKRRHSLIIIALLLGAGIPAAFLLLILAMAFFGNPAQSAIALRILSIVGTGVGGAGCLFLVGFAINRLIKR